MVGERRGEYRSRTGEYGGTVRAPSTPARAARSALAVDTLVNGPGYDWQGMRLKLTSEDAGGG
jgi:hypothetical protein